MMEYASHQPEQRLTRRQFLAIGWTVAGLLAAGETASAIISFVYPSGAERERLARLQIAVGSVGEIKQRLPLGAAPMRFPDQKFYISRTEDGLIAMVGLCTHLKCVLPWNDTENQFHCPCHGALYDRKGDVLGGPAPRPLDLFRLRVEYGDLVVDTSQPIQRKAYDPSQAVKV